MTPVLETRGLAAGYGGRSVISDINVTLNPSEVLCVIGHNGAGKSTMMKTMFGLISPDAGSVHIDGEDVTKLNPRDIAELGVAMVPEGRGVFPSLSVSDIFALGMHAVGVPKAERAERLGWVLGILPAIREFMERPASTLSGGQQQMVSIGRALLPRPRILLMDEPSIGLAPKLFQDLLAPVRKLQQEEGLSILLVEQNVREALKISDRALVVKSGAIAWTGEPEELADNKRLIELY